MKTNRSLLSRLFQDKRPHVAQLILRLVGGGVIFYEGLAKLLTDPTIVEQYFTGHGFPAAFLVGPFISVFEFAAGLLIVLGIYTRSLALLVAIEMVVALVVVNLPNGSIGGTEVALLVLATMLSLFFAGEGRFSVKELARKQQSKKESSPTTPATTAAAESADGDL